MYGNTPGWDKLDVIVVYYVLYGKTSNGYKKNARQKAGVKEESCKAGRRGARVLSWLRQEAGRTIVYVRWDAASSKKAARSCH